MARASQQRDGEAEGNWQEVFLDALAASSNVAGSARKAHVGTAQAYALRRKDAVFARRWQEALSEGYELLELELLSRLRKGELKAPLAKGEDKPRVVRVFDNGMALRLLLAHKDAVARQRAVREHIDADSARARIDARLDAMRAQIDAARHALPTDDIDGVG